MQMLASLPGMISNAGAAMSSPNVLGALRTGTSALSALSSYGLAASQAGQMDSEADLTRMAASQTYIQAEQQSNDLMRQYQAVTGKQLVTAAAEGIDVGSGSVQAQQGYASQQVMRQINEVRQGATMNASLRLARAYALSQAAGQTRIMGALGAVSNAAGGVLQQLQIGGRSKSGGPPGGASAGAGAGARSDFGDPSAAVQMG